tara:strand:+ start:2200 stop:2559 length:360 start_codon:yes stop_codon:yes gene_type:complete
VTIPQALDAVVAELVAAGLPATRDAGAFFPAPIGVLVGMPSLIATGLASRTLEVPVHIISADPPSPNVLALMYAAADDAAAALQTNTYSATTWSNGINAEPLPALNLLVTVTIENTVEV